MADDFLSTYAPLANDIATRTNIDPSVVLGIIDTETGHGQHVSGNNIFGISPSGPRGQYVAGYPDVQTASNAFINLMQTPRYSGVAAASDPVSQATALVKGGYNTANPNYASIVANKALSIGKQLGYQGDGQGGNGATIAVTSSQPAPDYSGQPTASAPAPASAPDYNTPAPAAAPAPTQPPAGSAKDRVLADPALSTGSSDTATTAQPPAQGSTAKDRVLADPALQTGDTVPAKPLDQSQGYIGPDGSYVPPQAIPGPNTSTTSIDEAVHNALQPAPNTTYGNVLPVARDDKTGALRFAMPNMLRAPLLGLTGEGPQVDPKTGSLTVPGATWNPQTGTFGLTPEASSVAPFAASPLRFSGANPLLRPPTPTIGSPLPPTADELTAAVRRADQMPPRTDIPTVTVRPPGAQAAQPAAAAPAPNLPPVPDGYVRLYHGGADPTSGGARWVTPDYAYARDYRPGQPVSYVDVPKDNPAVQAAVASHHDEPMRVASFNAPEDIAAQLRPVDQPAAVGAEATTAPIPEKTPAQAQRDLETSVAQTATDRAGPQMQDHTVYVPGVQRTLAEREFSPQNSLDEKAAIGSDTAFRQQIEKVKRDNNETMVDVLRNDAGDKIALDDAYTARESVTPPSLQLFRDEVPVDAAPIVQQIDDILAGPSGKRGAVASTLQNVRSKLFDSDGNLETMPSQLYGARQNITDLLKKGARAATEQGADAQAAKAQLESLLEPFDGIINQGAPRYQQYLSDFRDASKPINQMEYLQQFQPSGARNVASAGGNLTFNKVNNMLSQITRDRAARGVNKAKSLTDDQINHVIAVRNELAAVDLKERLAAVRGSDTFQQLQRAGQTGAGPVGTAIRGMAGVGAEGLAHALIATPTAGVGNVLLAGGSAAYRFGIKPAMKAAGEKRAAQKLADAMAARKAALLETQPAAGGPP